MEREIPAGTVRSTGFFHSRLSVFGFLILTAFLLFGGSVRMYFLQDDFYQFSRASNPMNIDWREAFSLESGYYRPLTQRVFAAVQVWAFGYNPVPHHLLSLVVFSLNGCLLFLLIERIVGNRSAAFLGAFFYLTRSAHFLKLYWISASAEAWMFFFFLISILLFLVSESVPRQRRIFLHVLSVIAYGLSLLCKESILLLPILLTARAILFPLNREGGTWKSSVFGGIRTVSLHWSAFCLYLALRLHGGGLASHGEYLTSHMERVFLNAIAYLAMLFDCNREILRYGQLQHLPPITFALITWVLLFCIAWIVIPATAMTRRWLGSRSEYKSFLRSNRRALLLSCVWMAIGAIPLAAMTLSFYGYYMTPFLGGAALFLAIHIPYLRDSLLKTRSIASLRRLTILILLLLFSVSFFSVRLQESLPYSNFQRAEEVRTILEHMKRDIPPPPDGSVIEFTGLTRKQYWALGWGYSLNFVYGNRGYQYYSEFDEVRTPDTLPVGEYLRFRWVDGRFVQETANRQPGK